MPSALIGALRATLGLDTAQFDTNVDRSKAKASGLKDSLKGVGEELLGLSAPFAVGITAATAFAGGMQQAADAMNYADDIAAQAYKLGESAEWLQAFNHAAEASDVPAEAAVEALNSLSSAIGALQSHVGDGKIRKAMEGLGISQEQIDSFKTVEDALPVLADKISQLGTITEQTAFAKKFGIEALLPLLKQGSVGIGELMQNARDLGFVMDESVINQMADMNEELRLAEQRSKMAGLALGTALAPAMLALKERTAELVIEVVNLLEQFNKVEARSTRALTSARDTAYWKMSGLLQGNKTDDPNKLDWFAKLQYDRAKQIWEESNAELEVRRRAAKEPAGSPPPSGGGGGGGGGSSKKSKDRPNELDVLRSGPDSSWRSGELWTLDSVIPGTVWEQGPLKELKPTISAVASDGLLEGQLDAMQRGREEMRAGFQYAIEGAFYAARQGPKALLLYFAQELQRALWSAMAAKGAGFLEGKIFSASGGLWAGLRALTGFATTGDFTVGGVGGADSQLRALRLTPGEKVSVTRPSGAGAQADGGALLVQVTPSPLFDVTVRRVSREEAQSAGVQAVQASTGLTQEKQARAAFTRIR